MNEIMAISPIDGRYTTNTKEVSEYFSEYALIKYRVIIEIKWLKKLFDILSISVSNDATISLNKIIENFSLEEAEKIKKIESTTNHDVKAVEYYLRDKLTENNLQQYCNYIHFGCTSEDINNLAYNLMIKNALTNIFIPNAEKLVQTVSEKATEWRAMSMLAHTHGQAATPTTVGKELAVFVYRWKSILNLLKDIKLRGKFSGAVGNFNAHLVAYPNLDWIQIAKEFVNDLDLEFNPLTTQIESHDMICVIFNYIKSFNNITLDFDSDMWIYISMNYFKQIIVKNEVGSSVMPHKVNPINFENSMANVRISNGIFNTLSENLQISRMQRDLSDSSALRNIGVGFAHSLIAINQTLKGFSKVNINEEKILKDLTENSIVISEAIQTVLRKNGVIDAYEQLKELTRGEKIALDELRIFINSLNISEEDKRTLMDLTPSNYLGLASELVDYINKN